MVRTNQNTPGPRVWEIGPVRATSIQVYGQRVKDASDHTGVTCIIAQNPCST